MHVKFILLVFFLSVLNTSTGSSLNEASIFPADVKVRRAFSCPEMKKSTSISALSVGDRLPLDENDEDENAVAASHDVGSNSGSQSEHSTPTVNGHTPLTAQVT